jgi:N,N'-diacetyllegionaminate synthase
MEIDGRLIGPGQPAYIIAEAGLAHLGSLDIALQMADVAKAAGADAFKTQAFDADTLYPPGDWQDRLRPRALSYQALRRLKDHCAAIGTTFLLTPHDDWGFDAVQALDLPAIKIGSGEKGNAPFIARIGKLHKPTIISTGMQTENEIAQSVQALGHHDVALLHCVTAYPVPWHEANLGRIRALQSICPLVGYSDHTAMPFIPALAVGMGAKIIEVHFKPPVEVASSNDAKASFSYEGLKDLIAYIRNVECAIGAGDIEPRDIEHAQTWALKDPATNRRTIEITLSECGSC